MKIISVVISLLIMFCMFCGIVFGDVLLKTGYIHTILDNASEGWYKELAYEKLLGDFSVEASAGHFSTRLRGRENYWIGEHKYEGEWKKAGTLNVVPLMLTGRYHKKGFFIGGGAGLALKSFKEKYDGKAKVNNRFMGQAVLGYNYKNWGIEVKRLFADLDIESGSEYIGVSEDRSHLHSWVFCLTKRF